MGRWLSPVKAKQLQRNLRQLRVSIFCFLLTFLVLRNTIGAGKFGTPAQDFEELKHHFHFHHRRPQDHISSSSIPRKQRAARVLTEATVSSSFSSSLLEDEAEAVAEEEMAARSSSSAKKLYSVPDTFLSSIAGAGENLADLSSALPPTALSSSSWIRKTYAVSDPSLASSRRPVLLNHPKISAHQASTGAMVLSRDESLQRISEKTSISSSELLIRGVSDNLRLTGWKRLGMSGFTQPKSLRGSDTDHDSLTHSSSSSEGSKSVLIVTGFWPSLSNCAQVSNITKHFHLRSLKNKLSFAKLHHNSTEILYHVGPTRPGEPRLSLLMKLMTENPQVEWLWWMDSDAFLTDISFDLPLQNYAGRNLVFYGNAGFDMGTSYGENAEIMRTGNFLIRNCEWSLHFLQRWTEVSNFVSALSEPGTRSDRSREETNDEELAVTLMLNRERIPWESKVYLDDSYSLQGHDWLERFADLAEFPAVVNFDQGCSRRCEAMEACFIEMERVLRLSDH